MTIQHTHTPGVVVDGFVVVVVVVLNVIMGPVAAVAGVVVVVVGTLCIRQNHRWQCISYTLAEIRMLT